MKINNIPASSLLKSVAAFLFLLVLFPANSMGNEKVIRLYHDADWSNHEESAESIWRGVETALSEIGHTIQGHRFELVKKDHRGNVIRSLSNFKAFLKDDLALAVISGIHSPPLIKNRKFINENKALTLVPWAAGGPITRYPSKENWIFRLSVDDTKAGSVLANFALNAKSCIAPHLLLENTPWGDSNLKNIKSALAKSGKTPSGITRFSVGVKGYTTRNDLMGIYKSGADCILLVASVREGAQVAEALIEFDFEKPLPIISHWGITAGDFHKRIDARKREKISLNFIQSCFSFLQNPQTKKAKEVFQKAKAEYPDHINEPKDIKSPVGFIHGYDLTKLLIEALRKTKLTTNMQENRNNVRLALENLNSPVEGLIKTYKKPFDVFSESNPDAHEALGLKDLCMAHYGKHGEIVVLGKE
jgi:branched-chain amino acid transport system substrate-binding protein